MPVRHGVGWKWFGAWAVLGLLATFSIVGLLSYGLLAVPLAVVVAVFLIPRSRIWPEIAGLAVGVGAIALLLAWIHRDYQGGCSGIVLGSEGQTSCGGVPPMPALAIGLVLVAGGVLAYGVFRSKLELRPLEDESSNVVS